MILSVIESSVIELSEIELSEIELSLESMLYEGDTGNRWRDGQVSPDVDKELWRLGPDSSGVFWRVMSQ
ncbi:hypothetical protein TNCV_2429021 [Trichonephila clavipes]|nr:hypothetical protein TNCV_2429021 [Trichonephila clavipes]